MLLATGCTYAAQRLRSIPMYSCTEELIWLLLYDTVRHLCEWMPFSYVEDLILGAFVEKD